MLRSSWLLAACLALAPSGCWAGQNSAASSEYARQVSTVQLRNAQLEAALVQAEMRIEQLEEVIRLQGQSEAERLDNIDEVNAEVARLRGAIEVLQFENKELRRSVDDQQLGQEGRQLYDEMRLGQIEKFLGVKPPPKPAAVAAPDPGDGLAGTDPAAASEPAGTPDDEAPADVPETAEGKLDLAAKHMEEGRQVVARAILKRAVEEHVGSKLMPEIRYRQAETWFNEEQWSAAVAAFNEVVNNHPDSAWKCWAYFRMGECFEAMGKAQGAKSFFSGAGEGSCKGSDAAKEAKKR